MLTVFHSLDAPGIAGGTSPIDVVSRCPLCATIGKHDFAFDGRWQIYRCPRCGLRWLWPRPADPASFYPAPDKLAADFSPVSAWRRLLKALLWNTTGDVGRRLWPRWPPVTDPQRLLDVGCGDGRYLRAMRALGWDVVGVEWDQAWADLARQVSGAPVYVTERVGEGDWPAGSFGVVTLWHVLEHLPEPLAALTALWQQLAPGGYLLLEVPNANSWQAECAGERWLHWDPPRHLWHFTPHALRRLLEQAGCSDCRLRTGGNLPGWQLDRHGRKWLRAPMAWLLARLAAAAGRGGVLLAHCRKGTDDA